MYALLIVNSRYTNRILISIAIYDTLLRFLRNHLFFSFLITHLQITNLIIIFTDHIHSLTVLRAKLLPNDLYIFIVRT